MSMMHSLPVEFAIWQQAYPLVGNHVKRQYGRATRFCFIGKKQHYVKLDNSTPLRAFFVCDGVELKQFGN